MSTNFWHTCRDILLFAVVVAFMAGLLWGWAHGT